MSAAAASAPASVGAAASAGVAAVGAPAPAATPVPSMKGCHKLRIGQGYDVHAFAAGRPLIVGGVHIPYERGLDGHSDADVLAHAVADAVLSAARLGDIGELFPDTDDRWLGANSMHLLALCAHAVADAGYEILDVDAVIIAQAPKMAPHREAMRANIAAALGLSTENIGIKATTTEHLGFEGRGEGIAASAVALLQRCCAER